jgi:hypothetical protein
VAEGERAELFPRAGFLSFTCSVAFLLYFFGLAAEKIGAAGFELVSTYFSRDLVGTTMGGWKPTSELGRKAYSRSP